MSFDNFTVNQLRRLVRNMIDHSGNELIQEILEKSFGSASDLGEREANQIRKPHPNGDYT